MDLSQIPATLAKEDTGVPVPLTQPNGQPDMAADGTPATITLVGQYSAHYRQQERAWQDAQVNVETDVTVDAYTFETMVWSITDWHGIEEAGEPIPCTPDNVRRVLRAVPWLHDQVRVAMRRRDRFFPSASAS